MCGPLPCTKDGKIKIRWSTKEIVEIYISLNKTKWNNLYVCFLFCCYCCFSKKNHWLLKKIKDVFFDVIFILFKFLLTNSFSVFIVKAGKIDRLLLFVICLLGTFCTWMYTARQPSGPWTGTRTGSSPRGSSSSLRRSSPWRRWIRSVAFSFCLKQLDKYLDLKI